MFEIGFQSPSGPTIESSDLKCLNQQNEQQIFVSKIPMSEREHSMLKLDWKAVFPSRRQWRFIDSVYCCLNMNDEINIIADGCDLVVIIVRGRIVLDEKDMNLDAISLIYFNDGEFSNLKSQSKNTLILCVRIFS